jgi:hypothetical protein
VDKSAGGAGLKFYPQVVPSWQSGCTVVQTLDLSIIFSKLRWFSRKFPDTTTTRLLIYTFFCTGSGVT